MTPQYPVHSSRLSLFKLLRSRKRSQVPEAVHAAAGSELFDEWKIHSTRKAISEGWSKLAEKNLTPVQRRAIREHLDMNIAELRRLLAHQKDAYNDG
jgi:hypothetical protein